MASKSKPTYSTFSPDLKAREHLLIGRGIGGGALLELASTLVERNSKVRILYLPDGEERKESSWLSKAVPMTESVQSEEELEIRLKDILSHERMGIRLYVAGEEGFLWKVKNHCSFFGVEEDEIQLYFAGRAVCKVYCVHCQTLHSYVESDAIRCKGCGEFLTVRDHFSRRIGAYMGVAQLDEREGKGEEVHGFYAKHPGGRL